MEAAVILNRNKGDRGEVAAALSAVGVAAKVEAVDGGAICDRAEAAVKGGARLIIVGGGDGSVSSAAQALAGSGAALGIMPLGTLNHLARDLGSHVATSCAKPRAGSSTPRAMSRNTSSIVSRP